MKRTVIGVLGAVGVAVLAGGCASDPPRSAETAMAEPEAGLEAFGPMAGVWRARVGSSVFEEWWSAPAGRNMTGALRAVDSSGEATLFELMTIRPVPGGYRMRLRHFGAGLDPWASEADGPIELTTAGMEGGVAVFTDADASAGGLRRMRYDLSEPGRMMVTLEFGEGREPLVVAFERVR